MAGYCIDWPYAICYFSGMKLSESEARILNVVALRGDASVEVLATKAGISRNKARYAFERLLQQGMITRRVVVNSFRLGFSVYGLWFSLSSSTRKSREALIEYCRSSKFIGYFGEFAGEYSYKADIYVRSLPELNQCMDNLYCRFGAPFSTRSLSATLAIYDFPLKYLAARREDSSFFKVGFEKEIFEVNTEDLRVLRALSQIGSRSMADIARELAIPLTTLHYRIKKFQTQGIIVGFQVWTQPESMEHVGHKATVHRLRLHSASNKIVSRLLEFARKDPAVFSFTHAIGDFDIELCSLAESPREEREFTRRLEAFGAEYIRDRSSVAIIQHFKITNVPF